MIVWCAYCQTWQGEIPPLDSWVMSHGICTSCFDRGLVANPEAVKSIMPVARFFRALRAEARAGFLTSAAAVLENAEQLGIRPLDLLVNLIQPVLDEIGTLWARGQMTVADEHRFSSMAQSVSTLVLQRARKAAKPTSLPPEYLLVNADGNHHTLGLPIIEVFLLSHGRSVVAVVPGLPAHEVIAQVAALQPTTLGISVAMPSELEMVKQVALGLADLPAARRPRLVVGGQALRAGAQLDRALGVVVCTELREFLTPGPARGPLRFSPRDVTSGK